MKQKAKEQVAGKDMGRQTEKQRHAKEPIISINGFNYLFNNKHVCHIFFYTRQIQNFKSDFHNM